MKTGNLNELLLLGPNQSVEYHKECQPDAVGRLVCAFLNSGGGYIVCGVNADGDGEGVGSDVNPSDLELHISKEISPKTLVSVEMQQVDGKRIIVVEVPSGKDIPYAYRDEVFIRYGDTTIRADIETIRDMVLRRQIEPERWERRFSSADKDVDLDVDEIRSFVAAVGKTSRIQFRNTDDLTAVLEDLSVYKYGQLTNGGDVLFAKNPTLRYPQARVRAVCFTSDRTDDIYRDMKSFEGPIVSTLEQVYSFIQRNTPTISRFSQDRLTRQDEDIYPPAAVREGLVNAFSHRDYSDYSGGIAVHIYPHRLEIWNSGSLPYGVSLDSLISGHISILRNPDIAHVLYLRGLMEKLGRGSVLIQKACEERGLPKPTWSSEEGHGVTLTFYTPEVTPQVTPGVAPEVTSEVTPGVAPEVTPEVMRVVAAIDGEMSRDELQQKLGLKDDKHFRNTYIHPALAANYIEMTIPDKPKSSKQKYRITALGRNALQRSTIGA
ncbi:MAG: Fic family protein [Armatimonadota bacterium]